MYVSITWLVHEHTACRSLVAIEQTESSILLWILALFVTRALSYVLLYAIKESEREAACCNGSYTLYPCNLHIYLSKVVDGLGSVAPRNFLVLAQKPPKCQKEGECKYEQHNHAQ